MNKKYLFVYGTLKKGFRANFLLENEVFISNAKTIDKFCMIGSELGSYPMFHIHLFITFFILILVM